MFSPGARHHHQQGAPPRSVYWRLPVTELTNSRGGRARQANQSDTVQRLADRLANQVLNAHENPSLVLLAPLRALRLVYKRKYFFDLGRRGFIWRSRCRNKRKKHSAFWTPAEQASKHHKQKRASLVATAALVVESSRTIVVLKGTVDAPRVMTVGVTES